MFKKVFSFSMIAALVINPISAESLLAKSKPEKASQSAETIKSKVKELGEGAEVKAWRKGAEGVSGQISSIDEEAFVLKLKEGGTERFAYSTVQQLDPTRLSYQQVGQPNPAEVRQVIVGLSMLGNEVKVSLAGGKKLKGRLQATGEDDFSLRDSKTGLVNKIAYSEVTRIEAKKWPTWATAAIVGGVIAGGIIIGLVIYGLSGS